MLCFGWLMSRSHCKATEDELASLEPAEFCSWGAYDRSQLRQDAARWHMELPLVSKHLNLKVAFTERSGTRKRAPRADARSAQAPPARAPPRTDAGSSRTAGRGAWRATRADARAPSGAAT